MDNQQERILADLNWLAAAWESEGWFSIIGQKRSKRRENFNMVFNSVVGIKNFDPLYMSEVIDVLKRNFIAYHAYEYKTPYIKRNGQQSHNTLVVHINGPKRVKKFLDLMLPFFRSKKERAQTLKQFVDYRLTKPLTYPYSEVEIRLYDKLRELNGKVLRPILSSTTNTPKTDKTVKIESVLQGNLQKETSDCFFAPVMG